MTRAPRSPYKGSPWPIMSISRRGLKHVKHVCHMQKKFTCDTLLFNMIDYFTTEACEACENQPIAHARARFHFSLFFLLFLFLFCNYILIIIKSACFTCDSSDIIIDLHASVACFTMLHMLHLSFLQHIQRKNL